MKNYLALAALVLFVGAGCQTPPPAPPADQNTQPTTAPAASSAPAPAEAPTDANDPAVSGMADDKMMGAAYQVTDGTEIYYTVQKEWLSKPTEPVTGRGADVSGSISYDAESGALSVLDIILDTSSLDSGSKGRDGEVVGIIGDKIMIAAPASGLTIPAGAVDTSVTLDVTIEGTTQSVPFAVTGNAGDDALEVSGSASITFAQFGLKAPSILSVYGVNDTLEIGFSLNATK